MEPVLVEQFFLGCLAHASYLVGSEGVAAVIDPPRDVDIYIDAAKQKGLKIEHIVETHLHADFVSGHNELAERSGARIYLGDGSGATFPHTSVEDGDSVQFGNCRFDFLQTPGHTIESVCIVMTDLAEPSHPRAVFTGDTLFPGGPGNTQNDPVRFERIVSSIRERLFSLPDSTLVHPGHGRDTTIGAERPHLQEWVDRGW